MLHFYKINTEVIYFISYCRRIFDSGCTLYKTELEILPTYM